MVSKCLFFQFLSFLYCIFNVIAPNLSVFTSFLDWYLNDFRSFWLFEKKSGKEQQLLESDNYVGSNTEKMPWTNGKTYTKNEAKRSRAFWVHQYYFRQLYDYLTKIGHVSLWTSFSFATICQRGIFLDTKTFKKFELTLLIGEKRFICIKQKFKK